MLAGVFAGILSTTGVRVQVGAGPEPIKLAETTNGANKRTDAMMYFFILYIVSP